MEPEYRDKGLGNDFAPLATPLTFPDGVVEGAWEVSEEEECKFAYGVVQGVQVVVVEAPNQAAVQIGGFGVIQYVIQHHEGGNPSTYQVAEITPDESSNVTVERDDGEDPTYHWETDSGRYKLSLPKVEFGYWLVQEQCWNGGSAVWPVCARIQREQPGV